MVQEVQQRPRLGRHPRVRRRHNQPGDSATVPAPAHGGAVETVQKGRRAVRRKQGLGGILPSPQATRLGR
eukprot:10342255-Heterocapsa_arctica.AAC.1